MSLLVPFVIWFCGLVTGACAALLACQMAFDHVFADLIDEEDEDVRR